MSHKLFHLLGLIPMEIRSASSKAHIKRFANFISCNVGTADAPIRLCEFFKSCTESLYVSRRKAEGNEVTFSRVW